VTGRANRSGNPSFPYSTVSNSNVLALTLNLIGEFAEAGPVERHINPAA
jgi:hypothetical protein